MNTKIYTSLILLIIVSLNLTGQNVSDIARWSYIDPAGTARTLGVGSAFGAMGGDYSVININPAGIADYRISEFTLTPSFKTARTTAFFTNDASQSLRVNKTSVNLDNIAFVFASKPGSNWTSSNFAIGFSRQADLARRYELSGKIPGSITTYFAEKANGIDPENLDDFIGYAAYNSGAIYDAEEDNFYETDFPSENTSVFRKQSVTQSGGINDLTLGWAGEYENKLNIGVVAGLPFYIFNESKQYTETDEDGTIPTFDKLVYSENLGTSGVGFNLKGGFTYKLPKGIRVGAAVHSPTWIKLTDDYSTTMQYSFNDGSPKTFDYTSPQGAFEYKITTPWKVVGSLGKTFRVGEIVGFVDADVEFIDYTNANYNGTAFTNDPSEQEYTNTVNREIQTRLGSATNLRVGTELGYKHLRVRGGYGIERTPFIADDFYNNKYSFGLGYREDKYFIDLGVRVNETSEGYNAYTLIDSKLDPLSLVNTSRIRFAATLGFKF